MNDTFPALTALDAAVKQTRPLSDDQRRQLNDIRFRLQELTAAAGMGTSAMPADDRTARRLRLALRAMLRPL